MSKFSKEGLEIFKKNDGSRGRPKEYVKLGDKFVLLKEVIQAREKHDELAKAAQELKKAEAKLKELEDKQEAKLEKGKNQ
jgi:hypothetical protein